MALSCNTSFTAAIGLLLFLAAIHVSPTSPAATLTRRQVQEDESIKNLTKQVYWGMEIFTLLDRDLNLGVDEIKYLRNVSIANNSVYI